MYLYVIIDDIGMNTGGRRRGTYTPNRSPQTRETDLLAIIIDWSLLDWVVDDRVRAEWADPKPTPHIIIIRIVSLKYLEQ